MVTSHLRSIQPVLTPTEGFRFVSDHQAGSIERTETAGVVKWQASWAVRERCQ